MEDFSDILFVIFTIAVPVLAAIAKRKDKKAGFHTKSADMTPWPQRQVTADELIEEGVRSTAPPPVKSPYETTSLSLIEEKPVEEKKDKMKIDKKKLVLYSEIMKQKF